jgi:hypothetical protein
MIENAIDTNTPRISDDLVLDTAAGIGGLNGFAILDFLKLWKNQGFFGYQIPAFVSLPTANDWLTRLGIYMFGAVKIGLQMPVAWQNASMWDEGEGDAFEVGSWGGHDVCLLGYKTTESYGVIYLACTWGTIIPVTGRALRTYCDEQFAIVHPAWTAKGNAPSGFDMLTLLADVEAI